MVSKVLFSSQKTEWETPGWLFNELDREFGFNLDVCATKENAKCAMYFSPEDDGLSQDWMGLTCWLNPPYGREIGDWVKKAYEESQKGATVVCLLPARTDTQWFWDYIYPFEINVNPVNADYAWAAGIIDGEGCIFLRRNKPHPNSKQVSVIHDFGIKVTMTDKETIEKMRDIFKCGHITSYQGKNQKLAWSWVCRSDDAANVLKKIYRYSITKKHEIFEGLRYSCLPKAQRGRKKVPKELLEERENFYQLLRCLKKDKTNHSVITTEIRFLRGRLKFVGAKNSAPFPSMVTVFRRVNHAQDR